MTNTTAYTPPTLTVDAVIFQLNNDRLEVLLVKRSAEPFMGAWALPGGYNSVGQTTGEAMKSIVKRKTGIDTSRSLAYVEQLYTFDTVARDPRGHAVSVTYMGYGRSIPLGSGTEESMFYPLDLLPELAFDHKKIIGYARERLAGKLSYTNAVYGLLSKEFTLTQLQIAYEAVIGHVLDKRNFRKKFLSLNLIRDTNKVWRDGAHRPAKLYTFIDTTLRTLPRSFE